MLAAMATKEDDGLRPLGVRVPGVLLDEIERLVDATNKEAGWKKTTKSDLVREMLSEGIEARKKKGARK